MLFKIEDIFVSIYAGFMAAIMTVRCLPELIVDMYYHRQVRKLELRDKNKYLKNGE